MNANIHNAKRYRHGFTATRLWAGKLVAIALLCLAFCIVSSAQEQDKNKRKIESAASDAPEAAAMSFAERHHPELAVLLLQLKEMDSRKFEQAVAEIAKTNEKMNRLRERLPERYETEIELWKIDSRIRLLIARSGGKIDQKTRLQIKEMLNSRLVWRQEQLKRDREKLQERLDRVNSQLTQLDENSDSLIERDLDRLTRTAQARSVIKRKPGSPRNSQPTATDSKDSEEQKRQSK